jgi:hypothetical protein
MREKTGNDWSDSDPSFIRKDATELFNWARRLGLSSDQVRDAVDSGLIKPASGPNATQSTTTPARSDDPREERPDGNA